LELQHTTVLYLHYVFPAVQWLLPSRYHSIHKNELARAMLEGTQKALAELQQNQAQGGAFPTPVVKFYEYSDMKTLFTGMTPRIDLAVDGLHMLFHMECAMNRVFGIVLAGAWQVARPLRWRRCE